jgi:hypothetical protein
MSGNKHPRSTETVWLDSRPFIANAWVALLLRVSSEGASICGPSLLAPVDVISPLVLVDANVVKRFGDVLRSTKCLCGAVCKEVACRTMDIEALCLERQDSASDRRVIQTLSNLQIS